MSTIVKHTYDYTVSVPQQTMKGDGKKIKNTIETAIIISTTLDNQFNILKMANQTNTDKPLFVVQDIVNDKYYYFVRTGIETSKYLYYLIDIPETDFPILPEDEKPPTDSTIIDDSVFLRKYPKQNYDEDSYDIYIVKVLDDMIHILCFQKIHGRKDKTTYRFFIYDIQENKSYWARSDHDAYNIDEWIEDPNYFKREIENLTEHMNSKYDGFKLDVDDENCELKITLKIPFKWEPIKLRENRLPTTTDGGAKRRHKKKKRNTRRNKKSQKRIKRKRNTRRKK